jgi:hypothetical protein
VHIRDDGWLKAAALYWPSVRRLVPFGYAKHDSSTAKTFFDAQILRDEDPQELVGMSTWNLVTALRDHADDLVRNYSIDRAYADWDGRSWAEGSGPDQELPALGWIHVTKFQPKVVDYLSSIGLAQRGHTMDGRHSGQPENWIGLHPALASAYMAVLASQLSAIASFEPLTDQVDLRVATPSGDIEAAMRLLLGRAEQESTASRPAGAETYVMLALQYARPADLDSVPAEKIVECRENLSEELASFRAYVASQKTELAELAAMPPGHRRLEAFAEHVEQTVAQPLQRLERGLRLHKLEPTRSLLLAGEIVPPAGLGVVLDAAGSPAVAAAATAAAVAVGSAWWQVKNIRAAAKANSPVGYLLDARDQLSPRTLADRVRMVLQGTYGRP